MNEKQKSGGAAPFGYMRTETGFAPDPHEAPIRKLIFELFLKYKRKLTVANELNRHGYRTRSDAKFSDSSVSRFLTDPIVKGHHKDNWEKSNRSEKYRTLKPESQWRYPPIEALVDEDTWNKANDILIANHKKRKVKRPSGIFTDFAYCSCGGKMHYPHGRKSYFCTACDNRIDIEILDAIYSAQLEPFTFNHGDQKTIDLAESWVGWDEEHKRSLVELVTHSITINHHNIEITFNISPSSL